MNQMKNFKRELAQYVCNRAGIPNIASGFPDVRSLLNSYGINDHVSGKRYPGVFPMVQGLSKFNEFIDKDYGVAHSEQIEQSLEFSSEGVISVAVAIFSLEKLQKQMAKSPYRHKDLFLPITNYHDDNDFHTGLLASYSLPLPKIEIKTDMPIIVKPSTLSRKVQVSYAQPFILGYAQKLKGQVSEYPPLELKPKKIGFEAFAAGIEKKIWIPEPEYCYLTYDKVAKNFDGIFYGDCSSMKSDLADFIKQEGIRKYEDITVKIRMNGTYNDLVEIEGLTKLLESMAGLDPDFMDNPIKTLGSMSDQRGGIMVSDLTPHIITQDMVLEFEYLMSHLKVKDKHLAVAMSYDGELNDKFGAAQLSIVSEMLDTLAAYFASLYYGRVKCRAKKFFTEQIHSSNDLWSTDDPNQSTVALFTPVKK
ncbi:MAG: hypothetical protein ABIC04_07255 [Nanoarchaeota archaeon]